MSHAAYTDLHDCLRLGSSVGVADIHHMKQQTGFRDLFQSCSEGRHQLRGQLLNEPYCVSQQHLQRKQLWSAPRKGIALKV